MSQKEYKTRYVWVGKMIHWELRKWLKFDHVYKWYMHKPESVVKNKTHKIIFNRNRSFNPEQKNRHSINVPEKNEFVRILPFEMTE